MRRLASIVLVLLSVTVPASPQADLPPAFPRNNATKLLEAERFTVWDIAWPKGQPTALHRHLFDQVGTYYARGGRVITAVDGTERRGLTEVGSLTTTRKGTTHVEEGTTDPPLRAVFIELKAAGPSGVAPAAVGPAAFPRAGATLVIDDARVSAWDYPWSSGADTLHYRAPVDTVIVWLGEGSIRASGGQGPATTAAVTAGTMRFLPRGAAQTIAMADGSPRTLFFQLK